MQRHGAKRLAAYFSVSSTGKSLGDSPIISDHGTYSSILQSCKLSSNIKATVETHAQITKLGYGMYPSVVSSLVSAYLHCDRVEYAHQLLTRVLLWSPDLVHKNMLVESLMKIGEWDAAKKVFRKMLQKDVVTWNSIIGGHVRNTRSEEALKFFKDMLDSNVDPDKFTFASAITACSRLGDLHHAKWVHSLLIDKGIELNSILSAALIDMYAKCGKIDTSKEIFALVPRNDVSVWNAMINGLAIHGLAPEAIRVFTKQEEENVQPDSITFTGLLTACNHRGMLEEGKRFFYLMTDRYSIRPKLEHYGAMIDLLGRTGKLEEAYSMIESMPVEPDMVIWRTLLSSCRTYKNPKLGEIAIEKISQLKSGDYVLLSNIYSSTKRWDNAEKVREAMRKNGVRKTKGKSWVELTGLIHRFKSGDRSHPESKAIYNILEGLIQRTRLEGFLPDTGLVLMDVSEEEKEENLNYHSEKLALAFGILKTSPGAEVRIQKNLRICHDCHEWIKLVSRVLHRVVLVRDRIRFHRFEAGLCSCGDYW